MIEEDKLYTKVHHNTDASASEGWTLVLMERGSRFLCELNCGPKDQSLFQEALGLLCYVIQQTEDLSRFCSFPRGKLGQIDAELLILDEAAIVRINNFFYKFLKIVDDLVMNCFY